MKKLLLLALCLGIVSFYTIGCPATPPTEKTAEGTVTPDAGKADTAVTPDTGKADTVVTPDTGKADTTPDATGTSLYDRLGKAENIKKVMTDFVNRVVGDVKINGYFLNKGVDSTKLIDCLVKQVGEATGGPEKYDCGSMKDVHKDMGISKTDFDDLVGHLVEALKAAGVVQADIDTIAGVLGPMATDIVEDGDNDKTIYQRIGRRPAIQKVVTEFVAAVVSDQTLAPFFAETVKDVAKATRLGACLVRQVCAVTGGPCKFGSEANETGIDNAKPCVTDMKALHTGMAIATADFNKLVGHLVTVLKANSVPDAEITAIGAALAPTCPDIVEKDPNNCGAAPDALYKRLGEEAGIKKVMTDFVTRVVGDSKINGYFLNQGVDGTKLIGCLVKQVGAATGGPQVYDCGDMKTVHAGMGISKADFDDLVGHLVEALKAESVAQADIDTIAGVLGPMATDIVEDGNNDKTVYQRIGRRPAITVVVTDFLGRVTKDTTLIPFFTGAIADPKVAARLGACLVRQLCGGTGGPCKYGKEANETGIDNAKPCVTDMKALHTGMGIAKADFDKLIGHAVEALKAANVPQVEIDAIAKVLLPMCGDIVETDPGSCP